MSDFTRIYTQMMEQGAAMARAMSPALAEFTPEGFDKLFATMPADWMEAAFGKSFNPEGLDAKTRLLITLGGLVATGAGAAPQIKLTLRHAVEAGATRQEIAETIYQMSMLGGLPTMNRALELAKEVFADENQEGDAQ